MIPVRRNYNSTPNSVLKAWSPCNAIPPDATVNEGPGMLGPLVTWTSEVQQHIRKLLQDGRLIFLARA